MTSIEGKNISYSLRDFKILEAINAQALKGEILMIVGPNGAGKSTLMSVLSQEIQPENVTVYFKNKDFKLWDVKALSLHKAKFSQQYNPDLPLTVSDIVMIGRYPYFLTRPKEEDYQMVDKALTLTDCLSLKNRNYNSLSGGEKQRVHLARVFAQVQNKEQNKVVFFDEPLNNLDIRHQYQLLKVIKEFVSRGNTGILILHDLNLAAQFGDKVLLLKKGQMVAYGTPTKVFTEEVIQKAYDFPCQIMPHPLTQQPMIIFDFKTSRHEV